MRVDSPLGIILVSKDDTAERVLFMYPFGPDLPAIEPDEAGDSTPKTTKDDGNIRSSFPPTALRDLTFGVPVKMLAPLLCPKESGGTPFEIKVDNIRFAGFPWRIENSAHSLAVVFVLPGCAESHLVDSFQQLSKKTAIAINSEQKRCNYLREQILLMQPAHDEFEALPDEQKRFQSPYPAVLAKSRLAQHLKEIFEDVCEYGMVDVFVDDCIEVGFCVEPKALIQAGLSPKSSHEVESIMHHVRPYHGILFLEDSLPSPDSNPFVLRFLAEYEPSRSIDEMSICSGLPLSQVLQIVKHYLMWARAIIIYPICNTNIYTTAPCTTSYYAMTSVFSEKFPDCSLAEIVEQFSIPTSLGAFLTDISLYSPIIIQMEMLIFLLRNQLLIQLHTFLYLLPPLSNRKRKTTLPHADLQPNLLSARIRTAVNSVKSEDIFTPQIKTHLLNLCARALGSGVLESEVFWLVNSFASFIPYLNGNHHIEDIMYRAHLDRSTVMRVIDTFPELIQPFYCADSPTLMSN